MSVIRLSCNVNNYHWGKHGSKSKAAQFAATNPGVSIDETKPYAELWMGTHPNGPSKIFGTETKLSDVLEKDPIRGLTKDVIDKFGGAGQLPFLFKVLSIEKALSIQAHPNKTLATKLHSERPNVYKDPNHKPEMSIALTDFIAMSGFRPLEEISSFLDTYPEFRSITANSAEEFQRIAADSSATDKSKKQVLKKLFAELMNADPEAVRVQIEALVKRVPDAQNASSSGGLDHSVPALIHRLNSEYPNDVGVFCVFMLNVLRLSPGQAFYMGPNDPHAYIYGDCVECMATSDNVVRAGLTPKLRDVPVLVDMLTYDFGSPVSKLMSPVHSAPNKAIYDPPIDEFSVVRADYTTPNAKVNIDPLSGPQVLIATEGEGVLVDNDDSGKSHAIKPGFVFFIYPNSNVQISTSSSLVTYTAGCHA